jgi:rhodanese-related sulfurtransferase
VKSFLGLFVIPDPLKPQSDVQDLQSRLQWGKPNLTIVDVRDEGSFYHSHIMGAVSVPMASLVNQAVDLWEADRDLYIYADTDENTQIAAEMLRQAGFMAVSELKGGLSAWQTAGYPTELGAAV